MVGCFLEGNLILKEVCTVFFLEINDESKYLVLIVI
jgi:hypothetical protein